MNPIPLDSALLEKLMASMQTVEICDPSGKVVRHFTPRIDPNDYEVIGPEISDEELLRRANSDEPRIPAAEVRRHLKNL
jgi:hypothetical protein